MDNLARSRGRGELLAGEDPSVVGLGPEVASPDLDPSELRFAADGAGDLSELSHAAPIPPGGDVFFALERVGDGAETSVGLLGVVGRDDHRAWISNAKKKTSGRVEKERDHVIKFKL